MLRKVQRARRAIYRCRGIIEGIQLLKNATLLGSLLAPADGDIDEVGFEDNGYN
jgi:hypothetical protein